MKQFDTNYVRTDVQQQKSIKFVPIWTMIILYTQNRLSFHIFFRFVRFV